MIIDEEQDGNDTPSTTRHVLELLYPALSVNRSLRVLHLASNDLQDDDMLPLCTAISQSRLSMLDLKSNQITSRGTQILAEHLPSQLERLWLLGNPTGLTGAQALCKALERRHVNLIDLRIPVYEGFMLVAELQAMDEACHYYLILNKGGRRIVMDEENAKDDDDDDDDGSTNVEPRHKRQRLPKIPLGLWPLVLERVNRIELVIPWGRTQLYQKPETNRAQVLYYLLQNSPLLRENH